MSLEISKIMKKIFACLFFILFVVSSYAQKDVTMFLGLPVDGSKAEMIGKLEAKGFKKVQLEEDVVLMGEFNGSEVMISVKTNGGKVYRLAVSDAKPRNARQIKIRFNNLCDQFQNNPKYFGDAAPIPDDENISYEMNVNNKDYDAYFFQTTSEESDNIIAEKAFKEVASKMPANELSSSNEDLKKEYLDKVSELRIELISKKLVWLSIINTEYDKYYLTIYYENSYNAPNGEDL